MSESIRDKFDKRPQRIECPSYRLRSSSDPQPVMLDLRKRNGDWQGLGYSYIGSVKYDRSAGLVVSHATYRVTINGRNLDELYAALLQQVVRVIEEQGDLDDQPEGHPVVYRIRIEEV